MHCVAGAHRSGTACISWLMYANGIERDEAIKMAKACRRRIHPIFDFKKFLYMIQEALKEKKTLKKLKKKGKTEEILKLVQTSS